MSEQGYSSEPGTGDAWEDKELPSCSTWPDALAEGAEGSPRVSGVWALAMLLIYVTVCLVWPEIPTAFLAVVTALGFVGALDKPPGLAVSSQTSETNQLCESASVGAQTEADENDTGAEFPVIHHAKRKYGHWRRRVEGDDLGLPNPNPGDDFMGKHLWTNHYRPEQPMSTQSAGFGTADGIDRARAKFNLEKSVQMLRKNFSKNCSHEIATIPAEEAKDLIDLASREDLIKLDNSAAHTDLVQKDMPLLSSATKRILEQRKNSPTKGNSSLVPKPKISPKTSSSRLRGSVSETPPHRATRLETPVFAKVWRDLEPKFKLPQVELNDGGDVSQINCTVDESLSKEKTWELMSRRGETDDDLKTQHSCASDTDVVLLMLDDQTHVPDTSYRVDNPGTGLQEAQSLRSERAERKPLEVTLNDNTLICDATAVDRNLNCDECPDGAAVCHKSSDILREPITEWLGNMRLSNTRDYRPDEEERETVDSGSVRTLPPPHGASLSDTTSQEFSEDESISQTVSGCVDAVMHHRCANPASAVNVNGLRVQETAQRTEGQTQTLPFPDIVRINVQRQLQTEKRHFHKRRNRLKFKYSRELGKLQRELSGKNKILCSLQLRIPSLEDEVRRLRADKRELGYDLEEERKKSQDLMCRLSAVYEKLMLISNAQQQQQIMLQQQQHLQQPLPQ